MRNKAHLCVPPIGIEHITKELARHRHPGDNQPMDVIAVDDKRPTTALPSPSPSFAGIHRLRLDGMWHLRIVVDFHPIWPMMLMLLHNVHHTLSTCSQTVSYTRGSPAKLPLAFFIVIFSFKLPTQPGHPVKVHQETEKDVVCRWTVFEYP
jgi:hypothetical protein